MKKLLFFVVACLFALIWVNTRADIPRLINYQGMLTNDVGEPLDGVFDMFFRIYNAPSGGDKRWEENHSVVSVNQGLFNVILGSQSGGIYLDFSEAYWLEIQVENDTMPERLEFTSVGYAYRALVADSALTATPGSGSNFHVSNSVLYTNEYWGIARGGAWNALYGDSAYSHVNLGVACTTGTNGASYYYCVVGGGNFNSATDQYTTVGGGYKNRAGYYGATIAGGYGNLASGGLCATIGGGEYDTASADYATVAGGTNNRATDYAAVVGGGYENLASGDHATLAGGSYNYATGNGATVSGGTGNDASGEYATVSGGQSNTASGKYSFAAGYRAKAEHDGSFVWADSTAANFASTGRNQFLIRASGGVGIGTNSPSAETRLHVQAVSDDFGVLVDAGGIFGSEIGLHTASSMYASLVKNAYFTGTWQRFNIGSGAFLQEVRPDGEVWFRVVGSGSNPISWTNALAIESNGNVGIGTTDPGQKLDVNGIARIRSWGSSATHDVQVNADGDLCRVSSSKRYKKNIRGLESHPDKILDLRPVSFEWKTTSEQDIGLIAEDVHELIPELVGYDKEGRPDAVRYELVSLYLLEIVKEIRAENAELRKRIEVLEGE